MICSLAFGWGTGAKIVLHHHAPLITADFELTHSPWMNRACLYYSVRTLNNSLLEKAKGRVMLFVLYSNC